MKKKGILGLDTVKSVLVTLLLLAVLAIVTFAVLVPLKSTQEKLDIKSATITNESGTILTDILASAYQLKQAATYNFAPTILYIVNATDQTLIPSTNYTVSNGYLVNTTKAVYNTVNITYSYTYNNQNTRNVVENLTGGVSNGFFDNVPTFFILLGVVVLILIIAIVIVAVTRFSLGGSLNVSGGESRSGSLESI